jgi:hypothetical protein
MRNEGRFGLRSLVGVPGTRIELSMEDTLDFRSFELTPKYVKNKSQRRIQPTFRAAGTTIQMAGIKFQDFGMTFQHIPEWKPELGMSQPLMLSFFGIGSDMELVTVDLLLFIVVDVQVADSAS